MRVASPVPSFLFLGLVVVAAALLIAGYGAPVGFGVIVGVVLGGSVVLALPALNSRTRGGAGSSYGFADPANQPDHELLQRHHLDGVRVAGVDAGPLRRAVAGGLAVEAGGARVELVALELRDDGGVAIVVAHTRPPVGMVGPFMDVTVRDDAGTDYVAAGQGSTGSNPGIGRFEVRFAPVPTAETRVLTIRISRFMSPFPGSGSQLDGPWEFRLDL